MTERIVDFVFAFLSGLTALWAVWVTSPPHQVAIATALVTFDIWYCYFRLSSKVDNSAKARGDKSSEG